MDDNKPDDNWSFFHKQVMECVICKVKKECFLLSHLFLRVCIECDKVTHRGVYAKIVDCRCLSCQEAVKELECM